MQFPVTGLKPQHLTSLDAPSQEDLGMKSRELYSQIDSEMMELKVAEQPWGGLTCHQWAGDREASACS